MGRKNTISERTVFITTNLGDKLEYGLVDLLNQYNVGYVTLLNALRRGCLPKKIQGSGIVKIEYKDFVGTCDFVPVFGS